MSAGFGALRDDDIHAQCDLALRMLACTNQCAHEQTRIVCLGNHIRWGRPERVDQHFHVGVRDRKLNVAGRKCVNVEASGGNLFAFKFGGQRRYVVFAHEFFDEVGVALRDHVVQIAEARKIAFTLADIRCGHHDVDAIRLAVAMRVDPVEFDFEALRRIRQRTQHTETASAGHGRNNIAAVRKCKERNIDTELVTDRRTHR